MFLAEFQAFTVNWWGVLINLAFYLGCAIAIVLIVMVALRMAPSLLGLERPRKKVSAGLTPRGSIEKATPNVCEPVVVATGSEPDTDVNPW